MSAVRALSLEYKGLQEEPVEGFRVKLLNDSNLFEWQVAIFGPPETNYQGGYFKVIRQNNLLHSLADWKSVTHNSISDTSQGF